MTPATLVMTDGSPSAVPARPPTAGPSLAVDVSLDGATEATGQDLLATLGERITALVAEVAPTATASWFMVAPAVEAPVEVVESVEVVQSGEQDAAAGTDGTVRADRSAVARAAAAWGAADAGPQPRVRVDSRAHRVTRDGVPVPLTHKEFGLLEYLMRQADRAVTREELLREVWSKPCAAESMRTIDVHVRRLRDKLGGCLQIVTVRGVGYRCDPTPEIVLVGSGDAD